uniref:Putative tick transposon n=1 Tax=Rhipicephalus microplus TaxID=6941 RepID=A0A6G5ABX4_RHIMP
MESARLLLDTLVVVDSCSEDNMHHTIMRNIAASPYPWHTFDPPFTISEIECAMKQGNSHSAPGHDGLTYSFIKGLFEYHPQFFYFIFNTALRIGHFPQAWRRGKVIFIPKPGRPLNSPNAYRPIVMNSVFSKVLERLLNSRLYYFLHNNNLLHNNQYGFTHNKSATLALYTLRSKLAAYKAAKLPTILISLDFVGAFDSVWHPAVLNFLRKHRCPQNLYFLLKSFLSNRTVTFSTNVAEETVRTTIGSPQGSPISPLLWNIVIYSLLNLPVPPDVHIQAYADDTIIVITDKSRLRLQAKAEHVLALVSGWAREQKVTVSAEKSFFVFFNNGHMGTSKRCPSIRMDGIFSQTQERIKILGVLFDPSLNFHAHIDYIKGKAEVSTSRLLAFVKSHRSLKSTLIRRLYRQVILPSLTYASPVWWPMFPSKFIRARVLSVQRTVLISLTGAFYTTRTSSLQILANAPPLPLELDRQSAEFSLFILRNVTYYGVKTFKPADILYPCSPWAHHPSKKYKFTFTKLSPSQEAVIFKTKAIHVYTDGSYTSYAAGAAYIALTKDGKIITVRKFQIRNASSAYDTELIAFQEALHFVLQTTLTRQPTFTQTVYRF